MTWVAGKAFGFLVKTIISEEFVKDLIKDYAKDFFKFVFSNAVTIPFQQEPLQKAEIIALAEFLQLVQQDLEDSDLSEDEVKKYTQPLRQFLKNQEVKQILGNAFNDDNQAVDTKRLQTLWYEINSSCSLINNFKWKRIGREYVQKVKEIIREIPELREILDSKNLDKIRENTTEIAGVIPKFDLEKYQEAIRECYGNLKLDSLDTSGYAYNELKLWRMFIAQNVREVHQVLPQVYELPKEHVRRLQETNQIEPEVELEELERHKRVYFEQPIRSVLDIVNHKQTYKYLVILGDPGSGKSTLLQYLALNWAESPLNNVISLPIPLLIELRTYVRWRDNKQKQGFLDFFHQGSGAISHLNQHQLHEQLNTGNAVVMFDGLDEVFDPGKREDVITDIHRFTNEYPHVQVIVTSRVIGYKAQRLRDAEFRHFMLQDLEEEQIQDFINRWHKLNFKDAADGERKKQRLQIGIHNSKAITELAGNPLLLTMMAILNRNQELPRDRAELYNQASRILLHQWDVERALEEDKRLDPKTIDYKDKQAMLRQVACHMQTGEKGLAGNLISADHLEKILIGYLKSIEVSQPREVAKLMINQLRTRNFMLCFLGADCYAFMHRTFLEYFCAWEFVWQFEKERSISVDDLKTEVFGKHWQDETWHEVLRLIAGMIDAKFVGEIIEYLMNLDGEDEEFINILLAAKCFTEIRNPVAIQSTVDKLLNKLKDLTKYDLPYYYTDINFQEKSLVNKIRTQAVITIATTWQDDRNILNWLKTCATDDQHYSVRGAAIQALGKYFRYQLELFEIYHNCTVNDSFEGSHKEYNPNPQRIALEIIVKQFPENDQTLPLLRDRAENDPDQKVQEYAQKKLAELEV